MAFRSVGTNLSTVYVDGVRGLAEDLGTLKGAGPDFVEVWPQNLGLILGGRLDTHRLPQFGELLLAAELKYTVHAPLEVNLMDLTSNSLQRDVLDASLRFAKEIGAGVVVCHAGQRVGSRDARHSMVDQLSAERSALRAADASPSSTVLMLANAVSSRRPSTRAKTGTISLPESPLDLPHPPHAGVATNRFEGLDALDIHKRQPSDGVRGHPPGSFVGGDLVLDRRGSSHRLAPENEVRATTYGSRGSLLGADYGQVISRLVTRIGDEVEHLLNCAVDEALVGGFACAGFSPL